MTAASRIVIDPEEVRGLATRMRGGAFIFSSSGRTLVQEPLPPMPASIAALVSESICDANAALQDLAVEMTEDASQLEARATWAELGGGPETAWLIPALRRFPTSSVLPASPVAAGPADREEQIRAGQEWASELLDGMRSSARSTDDGSDLARSVLDAVQTHTEEIPQGALGSFTLATTTAPELSADRIDAAGLGAGDGALGAGVLLTSPTAWGIVGCLVAGGLLEPPGESA